MQLLEWRTPERLRNSGDVRCKGAAVGAIRSMGVEHPQLELGQNTVRREGGQVPGSFT